MFTIITVVICENTKCIGVQCEISGFEVEFDHLLIAVGATTNTFGIPGSVLHSDCCLISQIKIFGGMDIYKYEYRCVCVRHGM